jgi:hypothetical protein
MTENVCYRYNPKTYKGQCRNSPAVNMFIFEVHLVTFLLILINENHEHVEIILFFPYLFLPSSMRFKNFNLVPKKTVLISMADVMI